MRSKHFLFAAYLICCGTSFFCAGQVAPSGGPVDTTPPVILESTPQKGELRFNGRSITIGFNKYVDRTSFQQSLFISPPLGRLIFDWSGKDVEIHFADRLRDSTTYVLTGGTDFHDTRNNRIPTAFSLAFSTGESLDSAAVSGRVVAAKPEGTMMYAYRLDKIFADTLNPSKTLPDYLTQAGTNGTFAFSNLALGKYRVIAVRDQYRNLLYDVQSDEYGVAGSDLLLTAASREMTGVNFMLTREDTTPPFLSSAKALDRRHVLVRFSESMRLDRVTPANFLIEDTATSARLEAVDFSYAPAAPTEGTLVVAPQESLHVYRLRMRGASDLAGNLIGVNRDNGIFNASPIPDTLKPFLSSEEFADSAQNILWDDTVKLSFTKAVQRKAFEGGCAILEDGRSPVRIGVRWSGSSEVALIPASPLNFGAWYTFRIVLDSLRDYAGNGIKDSARVIRFRVIEEKFLGSLKGNVIDERRGAGGKIHISTHEIASKTIRSRELVLDSAGVFEFKYLQEGKYVLSAYRDEDGNGEYSFGKTFPFVAAEPFVAPSDTIKIRARWPVEGAIVRFR